MASSFSTHIFAFFNVQTSVFGIWTPHSQRIYFRELILILVCLTLTRRCTLVVVFLSTYNFDLSAFKVNYLEKTNNSYELEA